MPGPQTNSGYVDIDQGRMYYETSGSGTPLILVHAGVADSQQWDQEFSHYSQNYQVIRCDLRGYGKSGTTRGPVNHLEDLSTLIRELDIHSPMIFMGCSMGGVLSMDYALKNPEDIKALIIVGPGMCGLELDVVEPEEFSKAKKAFEEGDLSLLTEIETQIWFDSPDQMPEHVDCSMRALLYEMQRSVIGRELNKMGKREPKKGPPPFERLDEIDFPVLIIVGSYDLPYMHAAADYMVEHIRFAQKEIIEDAAHLPHLDQPNRFQDIVDNFLLEMVIG